MSHKKSEKISGYKHKRTLNQKLLNIITTVLVLIIAAIVIATYEGLDMVYLAYAAVDSFFASYEVEDAYLDKSTDFFVAMDSIEREHAITIEIYSPSGEFVYSSSYKGEMSHPPYGRRSYIVPETEKRNYEVIQDLGEFENNSFDLSRDTSSGKNTEYLVGSWVLESGSQIKIFKVKSTVDTNTKIAVLFVSIVTGVIVCIAIFVCSILIRRVTTPLTEMSHITKNMSSLDFSQKCQPNDVAEIALLADSINEMSDSLETALIDLQQKNQKLQDDIEQEKTIDQLRQVFISGVSHELKTPIAIIQGYSEGMKMFLESDDPEMAMKYCDTIIGETERMNNLVMKLLDIIKYQSGEYKLFYEQFNIREIIDSWFERGTELLKEKGITPINDVPEDMICFGDRFILSTVVNNYMSNALSHVSGDMIIRASATEIPDGRYRISIFNTGSPIAAKDIDQIWNSFYRADKAMSRAQGRFGLGLAIVAAIQDLHEQDYGVINHENGVEFWFDVKKYNKQ